MLVRRREDSRWGSLTLQARSNVVNVELAHSSRDPHARVIVSQAIGSLPALTTGILPQGASIVSWGDIKQQFSAVSTVVGLDDVEKSRDVVVADKVAARNIGSLQVRHHVEVGGKDTDVEEAHSVETHSLDGLAPELKASADAQHASDLGHVTGGEPEVHLLAIFHVGRAYHDKLYWC